MNMNMPSRIRILSFTLLVAVINATDPAEHSKIVFSATATPEDVQLLIPTKPEEALPIILYGTAEKVLIRGLFPVDLVQVEIKNGRIWSSDDTRFLTLPARQPLYFCPKSREDQSKTCLARKEFQQPGALQCSREPELFLFEPAELKCGQETVGKFFNLGYEICQDQLPDQEMKGGLSAFSFCYNTSTKKNLFVMVQVISPRLLSEQLLTREREIELGQLTTETFDGELDLDHKSWMDAEMKTRPHYKLQTLASPKLMAFYAWKKTTNHFINAELQHERLIDLWIEINDHIAADCASKFAANRYVVTRVIGIPLEEQSSITESNQILNVWVTVVAELAMKPYRGIAILMNNFIHTDSASSSTEQYIDKICKGRVMCDETLNNKFSTAGGELRCCAVDETIYSLFVIEEFKSFEKVLPIRNIYNV